MGDWTTVPVRKATRDRLEEHPEKAGRDWDTFLRREILGENIDGDQEHLDEPPTDFPTSDVKKSVREVLREELPEGAFR